MGSITEADAARWALQFATVSYGDALFASAIALLLRPNMPAAVQVCLPEDLRPLLNHYLWHAAIMGLEYMNVMLER